MLYALSNTVVPAMAEPEKVIDSFYLVLPAPYMTTRSASSWQSTILLAQTGEAHYKGLKIGNRLFNLAIENPSAGQHPLDNKNAGQNGGSLYLKHFDKDNIVCCTPIKRERENTGRCLLKKGNQYVIVCSTEKPKQKGKFYLSVYFNQALRDVDIKRVFHPEDNNTAKDEVLPYFIPEEAEKIVNQTPVWKIKLVKESLKYMMTDEDSGAQF